MGLFRRDEDRTERFLRKNLERLAKGSDKAAADARYILDNDEAFAAYVAMAEAKTQDAIDEKRRFGGRISDFLSELVTWILTHQEEIKQLIAFITSLFVVADNRTDSPTNVVNG